MNLCAWENVHFASRDTTVYKYIIRGEYGDMVMVQSLNYKHINSLKKKKILSFVETCVYKYIFRTVSFGVDKMNISMCVNLNFCNLWWTERQKSYIFKFIFHKTLIEQKYKRSAFNNFKFDIYNQFIK